MADIKTLEKRIALLEKRMEKLEAALTASKPLPDSASRQLMEALYKKAKKLVLRDRKTSVVFLQMKLMIDMERAQAILNRLEKEGIIGPESAAGPRRILQ